MRLRFITIRNSEYDDDDDDDDGDDVDDHEKVLAIPLSICLETQGLQHIFGDCLMVMGLFQSLFSQAG